MLPRLRHAILGLALTVSASSASAQIFSGVDVGGGVGGPRVNADAARAAWVAAAGSLCATTETFEGFAVGTAAPINLACGMQLTTTGAPVVSELNAVRSDQDAQIGYNTTAGGANFFRFSPDFSSTATLTFDFGGARTAFGLFITGIQQEFGLTTVTWGANSFLLPDTQGAPGVAGVQFFGFVAESGVTSVTFTTVANASVGRDILGFDDVQVGAASVVPEPGAWALLTTGLVAIAGVGARRRRVS